MKRLRAHLARLGPAIAALFALSIAAPRAGFFYHSHPGGDHTHVHADDDVAVELLAERWDQHHHHHHHHHHPHPSPDDIRDHHESPPATPHPEHKEHVDPRSHALRHDHGSSTGHWHQQDRFQRGLSAAAPIVAGSAPLGCLQQHVPALITRTAARDLRVRGPPSSPHP
jgi:hypothetical protein